MALLDNLLSQTLNKIKSTADQLFTAGNNAVVSLGQSQVGKGIVNAQKWVESSKPLSLPQMKPFASTTMGNVGNTVANLPTNIGAGIINTPITIGSDVGKIVGGTLGGRGLPAYSDLKSAPFRLGYNLKGQQNTTKEVVGNVAGTALDALNMVPFAGGIKNAAKVALKPLVAPTLKEAVKRGLIEGGTFGLAAGGLSGLSENRGTQGNEYYKNVGTSAASGLIGGAALGAGTAATLHISIKGFNKIADIYKSNHPDAPPEEVKSATSGIIRNELGQFMGRTKSDKAVDPNNPLGLIKDTQITDADRKAVRKAFGLPDDGKYNKGFVDFSAKVGGETKAAQGSLYDVAGKQETPKTVQVWMKSKFSNDGAYTDLPVIRKENNITLYQGGSSEGRQFWTPDEKYAAKFGEVTKKTGSFYQVDNGNRMTKVYVEAKPNVAQLPISDTTKPVFQLPENQNQNIKQGKLPQSSENLISEARKQIGSTQEKQGVNIKQSLDNLYTQWVDRYHPVVKAAGEAKAKLAGQGAMLRPENDPEYLLRRLTGASGIADYTFKTKLNPILKEVEQLNIPKSDMDVYLANKRIAGFGESGRDIYGADPAKSSQIVQALESKYGEGIKGIAGKLYDYQNKGFQEMVDAGFISPEAAQTIKTQNPDYAPLYRVMDEVNNSLGLPARKLMQGTNPIQKIKGSTRNIESPIESIIGNTFSQRAAIEKNRVAKSIVELQKVLPDLGFKEVSSSGNDTIAVWNNGKKQYFKVGQDIADVAKGANEESMNLVLKLLQKPSQILRQGATGRNPDFMIPNVVKDQMEAGVTSKYGYIPFVDYLNGLKSMLTNDSVYQKWENSGAKIDFGEMSGKKGIKQFFDDKTSKKTISSWLSGALDVMGKYSEEPTRVGLFKKAYNKTGNELMAAMESRDATVDFARMGSKMKVANSIIPFLNVGVQGFDKLIRATKDNPAKVALNAGIYAAAPAVATTLYNLSKFPKEYSEIPQYEKDSNFVVVTGRNPNGTVAYFKIPKGNVVPLVSNPIESMLDYTYGNDKVSFKEILLKTLSQALPVVGEGGTVNEIAVKTIGSNLPQAIKPITENLMNKSFYKYDPKKEQTKEIVPSYLQKKPAYQQAYPFTPVMYQKIGAVLNTSPLQVQNLMEGYLAGYTKIPSQVVQALYNVSRGKDSSTNDIPIIRRFFGETYTKGDTASVPQQPQPSLMERITGKSSAAETSAPVPVDYAPYKKEVKTTGQSQSVNSNYIYKDSNGTVKTIDRSFQPTPPQLTGQKELDKLAISKFKGEITQKTNDIYNLFLQKQLTMDEANKQISQLKQLSAKGSGGGSGVRKPVFKKAKPIKMPKQKLNKIKVIKPKKVKLVKMTPLKLKKLKVNKLKK